MSKPNIIKQFSKVRIKSLNTIGIVASYSFDSDSYLVITEIKSNDPDLYYDAMQHELPSSDLVVIKNNRKSKKEAYQEIIAKTEKQLEHHSNSINELLSKKDSLTHAYQFIDLGIDVKLEEKTLNYLNKLLFELKEIETRYRGV